MPGHAVHSQPTPIEYLDFEVEIGPGNGLLYPLAVLSSPAGQAREIMSFPFDSMALESHLDKLENVRLRSGIISRRSLSTDEQFAQDFGAALFNALMTGKVHTRYVVSRQQAKNESKGLRIKLRIQDPGLAVVPWEFLYDAQEFEYVAMSRWTPVVRYPESPQAIEPLAVKPPLRILGMIAAPKGIAELDSVQEKQRVTEAFQELQNAGLVELKWLVGQSPDDLQQEMQRGPWHVFHFIGHGGYEANAKEGYIALADHNGEINVVTATRLARLLADQTALRLVVLNACEGAKGDRQDLFSSTAALLIRRGIPAVLTMQLSISDQASICFARAFYSALANRLPIDAALSEARKAMNSQSANPVEWAVPILYMRSPSGTLFNPSADFNRRLDLLQNPRWRLQPQSASILIIAAAVIIVSLSTLFATGALPIPFSRAPQSATPTTAVTPQAQSMARPEPVATMPVMPTVTVTAAPAISLKTLGNYRTSRQAGNIVARGNLAYLANGGDGLVILDISQPAQPQMVGQYKVDEAVTVALAEKIAVVAQKGIQEGNRLLNDKILFLDISAPSQPKLLSETVTSAFGTGIYNLATSGPWVYVASHEGVTLYNIVDPAHPAQTWQWTPPSSPSTSCNVFLTKDTAWITGGGTGLFVFDLTDPAKPTQIGRFDTPDWVIDIAVVDQVAYITLGDQGLIALDVSSRARPTVLGQQRVPGFAVSIDARDGFAYVTYRVKPDTVPSQSGMIVFDVQDPTRVSEITRQTGIARVNDIHLVNDLILVTDETEGVELLRLERAKP